MRKLINTQLNRLNPEEFKNAPKRPIMLILDNIRSLHNVGSIFRSADAFAVSKLYLCGITGTPPDREIHKTALGAEESMQWEYHKNSHEIAAELKRGGYRLIAIEQTDKSVSLADFQVTGDEKVALVLGNEIRGVSDEVLALCDAAIEIPQFGTKHSLNVAVTAGICLWHLLAVK